MTAKRRATLLLAALLSPLLLSIANGFATPKSDFVLDIDGNSISTSREHLCAIEKKPGSNSIGGRARCWGFDHFDGRTKPPQDVEFIQLATGLFFSCGIAVDQTVHCWGAIEKSIPGLYSQITSEGDSRFACGVLIDGSLNCWGFYDVRLRPPVVSGRRFLQISCSENHCCAIDDKGYPLCWGEKSPDHIDPPLITYKEFLQSKENSGWLVREEKEEFEEEEEAGGKAAGGEGAGKEDELSYMQFRQLAVGETLSCGISLLGSHLFCWGSERVFYNSGLPRQARGPWRQVSVGSSGVCAIRGEAEGEEKTGESDWQPDSLQCWGMAKGLIPTDRFPAWDQISVGSSFVCGVSMESEVECGGVFHNINDHKDIIIA